MERPPIAEQSAQDLVEGLVRHEAEVVNQVRALLEVHHARRLELRRELHAIIGQFGSFPAADNVRHLRLIHGGRGGQDGHGGHGGLSDDTKNPA